MNRLKCYTISGTIFVIIAGSLSHFVYEWSGNQFLLGFFFPVSESTWEHMKLLFTPMLICSLFINRQLKKFYPCITSALLHGILLGTLLIPVLFYTYSGSLRQHFLLADIAVFLGSVLIAFGTVYRLTLSCKMIFHTWQAGLMVMILAVCFVIFTYLPPDVGIFLSP